MIKPSAVQVALAKRLGLSETASKDEICRVAFKKMAAFASVNLRGNGKEISLPVDRNRNAGRYVLDPQDVERACRVLGYERFTERDHPSISLSSGESIADVDWGTTVVVRVR